MTTNLVVTNKDLNIITEALTFTLEEAKKGAWKMDRPLEAEDVDAVLEKVKNVNTVVVDNTNITNKWNNTADVVPRALEQQQKTTANKSQSNTLKYHDDYDPYTNEEGETVDEIFSEEAAEEV